MPMTDIALGIFFSTSHFVIGSMAEAMTIEVNTTKKTSRKKYKR